MMNNREKWVAILKVLNKYHSKMNMVGDLLSKLENGMINDLTPNQTEAIEKLYAESWSKDKIDSDLKQIQSQPKQEQEQVVEKKTTSLLSTFDSPLLDEIERRVPIGFKPPKQLHQPIGNYKMDTSDENIRMTKLQRFDALFEEI
jgi:hypothetical protein